MYVSSSSDGGGGGGDDGALFLLAPEMDKRGRGGGGLKPVSEHQRNVAFTRTPIIPTKTEGNGEKNRKEGIKKQSWCQEPALPPAPRLLGTL